MGTARTRAAGDTHPGLQRDQNEDRFFFDEAKGVYCVIDGVGGHNAGERAAAIASDVLRGLTRTSQADLRAAFAAASDAIYIEAARDPALNGMACVVSLAAIDNGRVRFAHVGDTRLYKLHGGAITKLTRDQSPVGELEDSGALTETEAMRHPRRNEIYKDLGSRPPGPEVATSIFTGETTFEPDAALLLCSDGLSDQVSSGSIRRIVEAFAGSPALAVQELLTAANDAGGKDNVTVVIVEGERFPTSVAARGPRRGGPLPAPARTASAPGRGGAAAGGGAAAAGSASSTALARAGWAALWVCAGLLLGVLAVFGARRVGYDVERLWTAAPAAAGARTWVVSLDPSADYSSIREAIAKAVAGDTVAIGPGEYREAVTLKTGVHLEGSGDSIIRPPEGAPAGWVALSARGVTGVRLRGVVVAGGPGQPLGTGLLVEDSTLDVDRLEVSGASHAGVELRAGAKVTLRHSLIRDNEGPGVVIRARAEPRLERNVIIHNGQGRERRAGVVVEPGASPVLVHNGIGGNGGDAVQGGPAGLAQRNVLLSPPPPAPAPAAPRPRPRPRAERE
jgi:serine/threonine protein phosphatase PrpC